MGSWTVDTTGALTVAGICHLLVFALLVPWLVIRSARILARTTAPLDRLAHFKSTAIMLSLFAVLSLVTARAQRMTVLPRELLPTVLMLPAGVAMFVAAVLFMRPRWRKAVLERRRIVQLFMPGTPAERGWWLVVSVLAGISEEITWRGVQTSLLASLAGSDVAAVLACAVLFGIAHYAQGWKSSAIIVFFALGFHGLVWLTGALYLAMLVHIAYDLTAGLAYGRLGRELGYTVGAPAPAAPLAEGTD